MEQSSSFSHLSVLESIKDAVIVRDLAGSILYANKASEILFGFSQAQLTGKNIAIIIPSTKVNEEKNLIERIMWGDQIENYETERLDKNNNILYVSINVSALKDEKGRIIGITKVIRNITEKKREEGKFQALLESAPDAMVIVNKFGQIILVNAQTEKLFGYERSALLGQEVEMLIPMRFKGIHPTHREGFFSQPKTRSMGANLELYGKKKEGEEFPVEISLSPIETEDGLLVSAAIRDITDQKRAAAALKEYASRLEISNKELEQFAYVASHDLQEPLRNITNYVGLLEAGGVENWSNESKHFLSVIIKSANRMKILIRELLNFSRVGRDRVIENVDCAEVINDVLSDLDFNIRENHAKVTVDKMPVIKGNKIEMKQLFQNLLSNALKFKKEIVTPQIHIYCEDKYTVMQFSVADNGIGIEEEYLNKLFLLFQRLHQENEYPGTGIGLATCKKIVELNKGKIWVKSKPGMGSTFYFTIPKG
jgi:PAS domain S-box-containing protein